jgi:hypothetical protein
MSADIVEIRVDTLFYIKDKDGDIKGVGDTDGLIEFAFTSSENNYVAVLTDGDGALEKIKFKQLCVAWLALNYPDSLKFDDT